MLAPKRIALDNPVVLLDWLDSHPPSLRLDAIDVVQIWGLVGLGVLARREHPDSLHVDTKGEKKATRFARAVGFDDAIAGARGARAGEEGRTVKLARFRQFGELEALSSEISRLLVSDSALEDTRRAIYYVLVELLRNVVQHSRDSLGGIVAAQMMSGGHPGYDRAMVQVAVGDAGIGIPASLRGYHPEAADPTVALERSLWPHVSGAFERGLTGNSKNAGLGLFFIAEMAKLTAGRLLIASRGATLRLEGADDGGDPRRFELLPAGFPGTLVAFELPMGEVQDYESLIAQIGERARQRLPQRAVHRWLKFEDPPEGVAPILVSVAAEDTAAAARFATETLEPRLIKGQPVALDFRNLPICTQSFLHALLYEPLRLAWAKRTEIYVLNAQPAVKSTLWLLESYALGG